MSQEPCSYTTLIIVVCEILKYRLLFELSVKYRLLFELSVKYRQLFDVPVKYWQLFELSVKYRQLFDVPVKYWKLFELSVKYRQLLIKKKHYAKYLGYFRHPCVSEKELHCFTDLLIMSIECAYISLTNFVLLHMTPSL